MPAFLIDPSLIKENSCTLTGKDAHHLSRVLRAQKGEKICLMDNKGNRHEGIIAQISRREIFIGNLTSIAPLSPPCPVHLFCALLKSEKMEGIVQKACELNIEAVHFIQTRRSVLQNISPAKWERLCRIAESAQKQCGRAIPLNLVVPSPAGGLMISLSQKMSHFIFVENMEVESVRNLVKRYAVNPPYALWIGPEGGWENGEVELATKSGFLKATLGPLVLRAETAAIHAVSTLLALAF